MDNTQQQKRAILFLLVNIIYFFSYFQRVGVPGTIFNELQLTFSLSATAVTGLASLTFLVYGFMQVFVGIIADRFGGFKTFIVGAFLFSFASLLFPFSYSSFMLFLSRAFIGFSASFIYISFIKILSTLYKAEEFPFYLGISLMFGYSGGIFATYPLERAVSVIGWRNSFLIAGVVCSIFTVICLPFFRKAREGLVQKHTFSLPRFLEMVKNTHTLPVVIAGPVSFGIYFLFQSSIGKKFLEDFCNFSSAKAASFTFIMMVANTLFAFLSSWTSQITGRRKPIIMFSTTSTLIAVLILLFNLLFNICPGLFLFSYLLLAISAAVSPVYITVMKEMNSIEVAATSVGFLNAISYLFISVIGFLAGRILDHFIYLSVEISGIVIYPAVAYKTIFLLCLSVSLISFLMSFSLKETG
ncbi:MAG: MFS transporter [Candidatus Ratteibacteria bacterium]|nr:MFS transporter [Candidatus Ratteibacteria bacterium]